MTLLPAWAGACFLALAAEPLRGADDLDKLARKPLSPGIVALAVRHASDPRAVALVKEALAHSSAPVRAVAARAVAVNAMTALLPDVKRALLNETDLEAAREEIWAVCTAGGPSADAEAFEATRRYAPRLDAAYTRLVARLRGIEALPPYFATLRGLALSPSDRRAFFRLASNRSGDETLVAAGSLALSRNASEDWRAILEVASERKAALQDGVLVAALRGSDPVMRGEAAWYLAKAYRSKGVPAAVSHEISEAVNVEASGASDPELRFGIEILRRVLGKPAVEDEGWIACLEANPECHLDSDLSDSPLIEVLTEREAAAIMRRNKREGSKRGENGIRLAPPPGVTPPQAKPTAETAEPMLRLVTGLPKGMVEDLMSVSGCRSVWTKHLFTVGEVEFWPHGLPKKIYVAPLRKEECNATAQAIFLMASAADDGRRPSKLEILLTLFDSDALTCREDLDLTSADATSIGVRLIRGRITAPKLVSRVEPLYPEASRRAGHQGASVYEAIILRNGCVGDLHLLRSSHPALDVAGMDAIAHWRYTPATLDGSPVRVYLTVTVTFNLH